MRLGAGRSQLGTGRPQYVYISLGTGSPQRELAASNFSSVGFEIVRDRGGCKTSLVWQRAVPN